MNDEVIGLFVVIVISVTIYKLVALKHRGRDSIDAFEHQLAAELADRDDRANALEERVRVLEKIITDTHSSQALSDEIENLKK